MFIITLTQPQILRRWRRKKKKSLIYASAVTLFPVLICENKIPANSCSINTKHLWGQAFTYTAQFLQAGCGPGTDNALLAAAWLHCDREGWAEEPSADKLTLTADTLHICLPPVPRKESTAEIRSRVDSAVIINAKTCWTPARLALPPPPVAPFSTLNQNSPPGLTLCVFHWETGKRRRKWRST